jgi:hypothetical protein
MRKRDYDVVFGMLERRIDGQEAPTTKVRDTVVEVLRDGGTRPATIHKALIRLADRGPAVTIVTTNFDLLLETAARYQRKLFQQREPLPSYSLGSIPRPGRSSHFSGVLHIHGAPACDASRTADLVVTDHDFGEFYLRRRLVPDFIYDAARLFHLVLVGYSANDAPMRYLLNAVAADGSRFSDLRERFAFVGMPEPFDPVVMADWKGRGITPVPYDSANDHAALEAGLVRWSKLSAINGSRDKRDQELRRIVRTPRAEATEPDRDLFDHLVRRSDSNERVRISELISKAGADIEWLDAFLDVGGERAREIG